MKYAVRRRVPFLFVFVLANAVFSLTYAVNTRNIAVLPLGEARTYAKDSIQKGFFPRFNENYALIQKKCAAAKDIPRIDMPVINTDDISKLQERLSDGHIDVFAPFSEKHSKDSVTGEYVYFPKDLKADVRGKAWLKLGLDDGDIDDDKVIAKIDYVPVKELIPTQSQLWLEVVIDSIIRWGLPKKGSKGLEMTIIVSREGYILDGHHRWAKAMLVNPELKIKTLRVMLDINTLLKMGRSYGNAIGNKQQQ